VAGDEGFKFSHLTYKPQTPFGTGGYLFQVFFFGGFVVEIERTMYDDEVIGQVVAEDLVDEGKVFPVVLYFFFGLLAVGDVG